MLSLYLISFDCWGWNIVIHPKGSEQSPGQSGWILMMVMTISAGTPSPEPSTFQLFVTPTHIPRLSQHGPLILWVPKTRILLLLKVPPTFCLLLHSFHVLLHCMAHFYWPFRIHLKYCFLQEAFLGCTDQIRAAPCSLFWVWAWLIREQRSHLFDSLLSVQGMLNGKPLSAEWFKSHSWNCHLGNQL